MVQVGVDNKGGIGKGTWDAEGVSIMVEQSHHPAVVVFAQWMSPLDLKKNISAA